jgi:ubiquitin-like modifier-activating enzyme ATG7
MHHTTHTHMHVSCVWCLVCVHVCAASLCVQATAQLHQLIADHDVVFLLTDTRESRWLPTLLAAAAGKMAITAALGFDTFLVMRHGLPQQPAAAAEAAAAAAAECAQRQQQQVATSSSSSSSSGTTPVQRQEQQLGCYFCNDVVAPLNSPLDRTLDQQCTVARPGLAPIAGALAVELLAALLQHPLKGHAPAGPSPAAAASSSAEGPSATGAGPSEAAGGDAVAAALGPVPHMIRGQLSGFGQICMVGQAFSQCTACSAAVLQQYASDGWGFILRVLQQPGELEELTGLAELHRQAAAMDLSSASSSEDGGEGPRGGSGDEDDDWHEL